MIGIGSPLLFSTVGESGQIEVAVFTIVLSLGDDNINGKLNPTPVRTTIEFRGKQVRVCVQLFIYPLNGPEYKATYTFPVGVTTLWWFAPAIKFKEQLNVTLVGNV